jgi:hypothetical protein
VKGTGGAEVLTLQMKYKTRKDFQDRSSGFEYEETGFKGSWRERFEAGGK